MFNPWKRMKENNHKKDEQNSPEDITPENNPSLHLDNTEAPLDVEAPVSESMEEIPETAIDPVQRLSGEIESLKNQLLRKVAEFENYKRRTNDEKSAIIRFANEGLFIELLSVIDDLTRSLKAGAEHPDFESFYKGIELVFGKLNKLLESRNVKKFTSIGEKFSVEYHDALLQMPSQNIEPNTIIDEIESGYTLHDKVIRHAKVIVAAEPIAENATSDKIDTSIESEV